MAVTWLLPDSNAIAVAPYKLTRIKVDGVVDHFSDR